MKPTVTPETRKSFFEGRMTLLHYPLFEDDRGCLLPLEWPHLPFPPIRAFVVTAPDGGVRGGHGHRSGAQLLIRIRGSIEIEARHGDKTEQICLDARSNAALIRAPVWARQTYRGPDAALLVLADTPYDPASVVYDVPG